MDLNGKKVLVVDDEDDIRDLLRDELEYLGASVQEAENGQVAWDILETNHFDLVITDIRMPGGDGTELLSRIKVRSSEVPVVIFITAHAGLSVQDACDAGADGIFMKPFHFNELCAEIVRLLSKTSQLLPEG